MGTKCKYILVEDNKCALKENRFMLMNINVQNKKLTHTRTSTFLTYLLSALFSKSPTAIYKYLGVYMYTQERNKTVQFRICIYTLKTFLLPEEVS